MSGGYSMLPNWSKKDGTGSNSTFETTSSFETKPFQSDGNWLYFFWKPFIFFLYLLVSYLLLLLMWLTYEKKECPLLV